MDGRGGIEGKEERVWKRDSVSCLVVEMGKDVEIGGLSYSGGEKEDVRGRIYKYKFYVRGKGKEWMKWERRGELRNMMEKGVG